MEMKKVNILWTGGLDSSCRIIELSRMNVEIQPYYIWDTTRGSIKQEIRAMKRITQDVQNHPQTRAIIYPVKIIQDCEIKDDAEITKAWTILNQKYALGSQYDYLARFAKQYKLKLEVGLESSERSKATNTIKAETSLLLSESEDYKVYSIDTRNSSENGIIIFENILLPATIWHMSKLEEIEEYKRLGFEKTIRKTWFCHRPVLGMPCGHCNPCKDCLNEGLAFRVPKLGYVLGEIRRVYRGLVRRLSKLLLF